LNNIATKYSPKPDRNPCHGHDPNSNPNPIAIAVKCGIAEYRCGLRNDSASIFRNSAFCRTPCILAKNNAIAAEKSWG